MSSLYTVQGKFILLANTVYGWILYIFNPIGAQNLGDDEAEDMEFPDQNKKSSKLFDETNTGEPEEKVDYCGDNYINADRFFLVASPVIFFIFNIIYWMSYGSQFILAERDMQDDETSG